MHIWAHILFFLSVLMIVILVGMLFMPEGRARFKANKTKYVFVILVWCGIGGYAQSLYKPSTPSDNQEAVSDYEQLGHKINKHNAEEEKDGAYYTDKGDSDVHYFTDNDNKITAIKYNYMPDPMSTSSVQGKLEELLNDKNLKYGNDKLSRNDTTLDNDDYNVYSPKQKKWYHMSMQKNDDDKVSTFSVWPGKSSDAE